MSVQRIKLKNRTAHIIGQFLSGETFSHNINIITKLTLKTERPNTRTHAHTQNYVSLKKTSNAEIAELLEKSEKYV